MGCCSQQLKCNSDSQGNSQRSSQSTIIISQVKPSRCDKCLKRLTKSKHFCRFMSKLSDIQQSTIISRRSRNTMTK